ncbi:hypothetical protein CORC01_13321 [Colletotrichum orchidophilum]|uniref:Uncharacterized protein n=1 Tax=Colletotrichum orchidophilum TaxID=1209926 RepID=A0A1G4AQN5_9PEZI|nr:uncharacterized protein CORC01_13321 [Colletotrichum orchidophilum]OHE91403.1 hypothetical protein CORC01_13321 [Colletotrichum orchidophilum]
MDMGMADGLAHSPVVPHEALPRSDMRTCSAIHQPESEALLRGC